ncbi:MAG TPA: DUF5691 domain-containing protein, partial [Ktedonobacterales bacterium]|nr:DUF5691 domain-containing protein [Ktedonobacterales bacterium]
METLLHAALIGTGHQPSPAPAAEMPTERLLARLPASDAERHLLLRAGAWATYRLAGHPTLPAIPTPEPAAAETLRPCSPRAAQLIVDLLGGAHAELLPEALALLRQAGQIMPPEHLLPLLARDPARFADITPLRAALGERGRWLAHFNAFWRWVLEIPADGDPLPTDADAIWQEGTPARRRALFRQARAADPARAREWLAAVWKQEKADMRAELVQLLQVNLSAADEPLLTPALDDKSERVRAQVTTLLARIPSSPLAVRMRERADAVVHHLASASGIKLPKALDPAWVRDGIVEQPPRGTGKRAWWLMQLIAAVPPAHWRERFGQPPADLIAACQSTDWTAALLEGWSRAALAHKSAEWIVPLWQWWLTTTAPGTPGGLAVRELRDQLGARVPQAVAEPRVAQIMADPSAPAYESWDGLVAALPTPWSAAFGAQFLARLRAAVATLAHPRQDSTQWLAAIASAGHALPPACFARA